MPVHGVDSEAERTFHPGVSKSAKLAERGLQDHCRRGRALTARRRRPTFNLSSCQWSCRKALLRIAHKAV